MREETHHRLRLILIAIAVALFLIAFFYDLSHSRGKSGEAISQAYSAQRVSSP